MVDAELSATGSLAQEQYPVDDYGRRHGHESNSSQRGHVDSQCSEYQDYARKSVSDHGNQQHMAVDIILFLGKVILPNHEY